MSLSAHSLRHLTRVILALILLFALSFLATLKLGGYQMQELLRLLATVLENYRKAGYAIYLFTFFLAAMVGIVPLSLLALLGGALYGTYYGFILSAASTMASSIVAFLLSRHAFRAQFHRWLSQHLVLSHIDHEIARRGWRFVLLLRLTPMVPFSLGSYAFGLTTVRLPAYLIGTLGALPALFVLVYTGSISGLAVATLGGKAKPSSSELVLLGAGLLFTLLTILYLGRIARKAVRGDLLRPPDSHSELRS